ncbi:hypothetical protein ACFY19_28805 [Streptosporangium saharense]|uniref:hypothetical protein n=1 Tax=Streptosporangium saharense TaxID=1706840 RepID=UPI0036C35B37
MTPESTTPESGTRQGTTRRLAPAVGLFLLAPLVGEYLLGNVPMADIGGLLVLAPMYGGGALLVRETARRTGRGWPTMVLLAAAYGVLEAGLIDQSLFNPSFEGHDFHSVTPIPWLGVSAHYALSFVGGHVIWSIGVPIALVEALTRRRSTVPWLGPPGLAVTGVLFVLGSFVIFRSMVEENGFVASTPQRIGAAVVVLLLAGTAFALGRPRPATPGAVPRPWLVGLAAFLASGLFFVRMEDWPGVALAVVLLAVSAVTIIRWSRRTGWGAAHRLGLAGGALLTYVWGGFVLLSLEGDATPLNLTAQTLLALGAVALLLFIPLS